MKRSVQSYALCKASAVSGGSAAQMAYFVEDAKADIALLASLVARILIVNRHASGVDDVEFQQLAEDALEAISVKQMTTNNGGPAFPFSITKSDGTWELCDGMTMRDYFAGQFMTGIWANPNLMAMLQSNTEPGEIPIQTAARMAFEASDAMLERGK